MEVKLVRKMFGLHIGSKIRIVAIFSKLHHQFSLYCTRLQLGTISNIENSWNIKKIVQIGVEIIFSNLMSPSVHSNLFAFWWNSESRNRLKCLIQTVHFDKTQGRPSAKSCLLELWFLHLQFWKVLVVKCQLPLLEISDNKLP